MEAILLSLIQQLNSSVFVLIAILLIAFWLIFKAGGIVTSFKTREAKNDKIDTSIDSMKDNLASIKATTDLLYQYHLKTVRANSPLDLTDLGRKIANDIKVEEKVNEHWPDIQKKIDLKNPRNPYDIQIVAMDIAKDCYSNIFTDDERNNIKTKAFDNGLNLLEIYPIIGIAIRTKIFKDRNIEITEVDKHDPSAKN